VKKEERTKKKKREIKREGKKKEKKKTRNFGERISYRAAAGNRKKERKRNVGFTRKLNINCV